MKSLTKLLLVGFAALLLAACSEPQRTTEWYVQNTKEQGIQTQECRSKPETKGSSNCINAAEAELVIQQGTEAIKKYRADHNL
ncbi:MAG: hypothetical protein COB62_07795 [Piscirickettsiaceae bacterium]|nr:MAG: hypothetical protein COB62_07795 [Piscirickettsiaceae bacterium]